MYRCSRARAVRAPICWPPDCTSTIEEEDMHEQARRTSILAAGLVLAAIAGSAIAAQRTGQVDRIGVEQQEPHGEYLADARGTPLYIFTRDRRHRSTCYKACARAWPPVTTDGRPEAIAPSLDAGKLGTIARRDGTTQVTYAGWPLYYYVRDQGAREPTGQGIRSFGGEWYLLSPTGKVLTEPSE
jgi:predicted lipoprotein with Yx(FWY)xxD motif